MTTLQNDRILPCYSLRVKLKLVCDCCKKGILSSEKIALKTVFDGLILASQDDTFF